MMTRHFIPSLLVTALAVVMTSAPAKAQVAIDSVNLTNLQIVNNVLTADGTVTGTLAGLPFTTQITDFALQLDPADPACSVLDLELAPIHLNLLGLHVDTSPICLEITAIPGALLGDLLCGLAGGGPLGTGLPIIPVGAVLDSLEAALNDVLGAALNEEALAEGQGNDDSVCTGQCEILELVLGPLELNLLGLNVVLDDCAGGPVQVCISASRREGLLGNLLCGLTNAQLLKLSLADITRLAERAGVLAADGLLSKRDRGELTALLGRLIR